MSISNWLLTYFSDFGQWLEDQTAISGVDKLLDFSPVVECLPQPKLSHAQAMAAIRLVALASRADGESHDGEIKMLYTMMEELDTDTPPPTLTETKEMVDEAAAAYEGNLYDPESLRPYIETQSKALGDYATREAIFYHIVAMLFVRTMKPLERELANVCADVFGIEPLTRNEIIEKVAKLLPNEKA